MSISKVEFFDALENMIDSHMQNYIILTEKKK